MILLQSFLIGRFWSNNIRQKIRHYYCQEYYTLQYLLLAIGATQIYKNIIFDSRHY